jgi:hypothetical protein
LFVSIAVCTSACAGVKMASPVSIVELRQTPAPADVGYTNAQGVPSVQERFAERPKLKVAVVQVAYAVQGRQEMTFKSDVQQFGNVTTWKETTTPELQVPTSLALASAADATTKFEEALRAEGFDVIPYQRVAETAAYNKYYGEYPQGYYIGEGMLGGMTVVGAPPMRVKPVKNVIAYGQLNWIWPDTEVLKEIKAELGEDVLLVGLKYQVTTLRGSASSLQVGAGAWVTDPDYVGYGVGGFGHTVTSLDAHTDPNGAEVPGFIKVDGNEWRVNWTPVFEDLGRVHTAFSQGWAKELSNLRTPPN